MDFSSTTVVAGIDPISTGANLVSAPAVTAQAFAIVLSACTVNLGESPAWRVVPAGRPVSRITEKLASWLWSDINPVDITFIASHGSADSSRHHELETSVQWIDSTELRVPADTEDFVASASFREG